MNQAATLQLKSTVPTRKRGAVGKLFIGLLMLSAIAFAIYSYWPYLNPYFDHFRHSLVTAIASRTAPTAAKSASSDADSLATVLSPSAKGETIQSEMPPAPMPAKRPIQTAIVSSPFQVPPALTAGQKRLKVAQAGFAHVMSMAIQRPDIYGFLPEENLGDATLGDEIPVYTIAPQGRENLMEQPVSSLLKPTDEWLYPIILQNHVRFLLQVRFDGHDYVPGDGSRALAITYDKILAKWPVSEGFHPQLITVPNLPSYYFTIPELPEQNITDTSRMLDYDPSVSPASIVLVNCQ